MDGEGGRQLKQLLSVLHQSKAQHLGIVVVQIQETVALFLLSVGLSPHCKHRCSSSFPGDMLRLVRSATQANGIYFCLRHVQPTICNLLSHAVSFQWRVHAVCQDTKVAKKKKKSGKSCLIKVSIWRRKRCMSKAVHPEALLKPLNSESFV